MIVKLFKLTKSYFKMNSKKTITYIMILGFSLFAFLLSNFIVNYIGEYKLQEVYKDKGSFHCDIKYLSEENANKIKQDMDIESIGNEYVLGDFSFANKDGIILYRDKNYISMDSSLGKLIEGRNVKEKNEVVINKAYSKRLGKTLGDKFEISFENWDSNNGKFLYEKNDKFEIVGICEDWGSFYDMNFILVSEEYKNSMPKKLGITTTAIKFNNKGNIREETTKLAYSYDIKTKIAVNDELAYMIEENGKLMNFKRIINICIFLIFALAIYNLIYSYFITMVNDVGTYLSLGFSKMQVVLILLFQILGYFILSIPIGLILAKISIAILRKTGILFDSSIEYYNGIELVKSILLNFLVVVTSVYMPMRRILNYDPASIGDRIIYEDDEIKIKKRRRNSSFMGMRGYTFRNLIRNKKKTVITVLLITLGFSSVAYIFYTYRFGEKGDYSWCRMYVPEDLKIQTRNFSSDITDDNKHAAFIENQTAEKIKNIEGIKSIQTMRIWHEWALFEFSSINEDNDLIKELSADERLKGNKEVVKGEEYLLLAFLSYGVDNMERFTDKTIEVEHPIIIKKDIAGAFNLKIGDSVKLADHDNLSRDEETFEFQILDIVKDIDLNNEFVGDSECIIRYGVCAF